MILCSKNELDLRKTFECGQCFRWNPLRLETRDLADSPLAYIGVAGGALLIAEECAEEIRILDLSDSPSASGHTLMRYFDLFRDYGRIEEEICLEADRRNDPFLRDAVKYCRGLRLLRQEPFETLISFIISANNNIPKIKMSIEDLCEKFGDPVGEFAGRTYHAFPSAKQLAGRMAELEKVRAIGYRARAISEAAEKIADGRLNLTEMEQGGMCFDEAVRTLCTLYGVGEKVANCVALFGLGHDRGFPVDTWIRKALREQYGVEKKFEEFVRQNFESHPGIAQQYMFFYLRETRKKG